MHEHNECEHLFDYCKSCDVVYCEKCKTEWKKQVMQVSYPKNPLDERSPYVISVGGVEPTSKYYFVDAVGRTTVPLDEGQYSGYVETVYHDHFNMGTGE